MGKSIQKDLWNYINDESSYTRGQIKIPVITDLNPIYAANFLTVTDCEESFNLLKDTFNKLGKKDQKNIVLEKLILYNKDSFEWYTSFALQLAELNESTIKIPYNVKENVLLGDRKIAILPPIKLSRGMVVPNLFKVEDERPLTQNRIKYIGEVHEAEEFKDGYPAWYMLSNTTIFEKYDAKTGVRSRIDFNNGEFHYYISGASDNWKKLVGVPLEMDYVVSSLLFRD